MTATIHPHPVLARKHETSLSSYRAGMRRADEDMAANLEPNINRWAKHLATYGYPLRHSFERGYEDRWIEYMQPELGGAA